MKLSLLLIKDEHRPKVSGKNLEEVWSKKEEINKKMGKLHEDIHNLCYSLYIF
jgi:hypothetical protein